MPIPFQDLSNSESGSETGLNCPAASPGEDDANLRPQNQATQTQLLIEAETDSVDLSQVLARFLNWLLMTWEL